MPQTDLCEIIVLLDRSGSMQSIRKDMEGGFDSFISAQRKLPGACNVTLVQFDQNGYNGADIETVYEAKDVQHVPHLVLNPRGGTPLLDATAHTILKAGKRLADTPEPSRPGRVLFLIITDGEENASKEYTKEQVKAMVEHQTLAYQWQFAYLGANVDAFHEARSMGIAGAAAAGYAANTQGVKAAFVGASAAAATFRSGGSYELTDEQRRDMQQKAKTP